MLGQLQERAEHHEWSSRTSTIQADLDEQWPVLSQVDLLWAATSMHHFKDPAKIFANIGKSLAPGGVLVLVEMVALPRYLPVDLGFGVSGFEERCHAATDKAGFNPHPDWVGGLEAAGFAELAQETFDYAQSGDQKLLARRAALSLSWLRAHMTDRLPAEDLATLDQLPDPESTRGVARRNDHVMRGSHRAWATHPGRVLASKSPRQAEVMLRGHGLSILRDELAYGRPGRMTKPRRMNRRTAFGYYFTLLNRLCHQQLPQFLGTTSERHIEPVPAPRLGGDAWRIDEQGGIPFQAFGIGGREHRCPGQGRAQC